MQLEPVELCFSAQGGGSVCRGVLQARAGISLGVWTKKAVLGESRRGLLMIWPGESALFPFGEDRLWIAFFAVAVDLSQTVLPLLP